MARGRPRKAGKRYPSGDRITKAEPADQVGLEARCRHFGISKKLARDARVGSLAGRLLLGERITFAQFDTGQKFRDTRLAFLSLVGAPGLPANTAAEDGQACGACGAEVPCEACAEERKARFRDRWFKVCAAVQADELNAHMRVVWFENWRDEFEPRLVAGLSSLVAHFGLESDEAVNTRRGRSRTWQSEPA
ncbi:hypothetical protein [Prosthecomicrobium sp. N25]|uniref:hypothetical protein n=1 Tax=Prosthecomicrobium sp. N25 TaxID=3129254 RepID=UPI0030771C64